MQIRNVNKDLCIYILKDKSTSKESFHKQTKRKRHSFILHCIEEDKKKGSVEFFKKFFSTHSCTGTNSQFHFADFFVNFFKKINDKINQTMFIH